jgi:pimeloyl-ACP methyl ester carboxylesterase
MREDSNMAQLAESGFAEVNGANIYYEIAGQKGSRSLVLLHEGIGDCRMYDDQFEEFAEHYRTIRFDMRGFGRSSVPNAPFSYSEDLYGLLDFLGVRSTHILGMSMGGAAGIDFTLAHPEMVSSLVLAGSAVSGFRDPEAENDPRWQPFEEAEKAGDLERLADLVVQVWVVGDGRSADQVPADVRRRIYEMERQNQSLGTDESLAQEPDPPAIGRLGKIQVPTLVVVGANDIPAILKTADVLAGSIDSARKVVIPDSAHVPNMEHPQEFNRLVLDFLASV